MKKFKWRDNLDFVNKVLGWWDKAANTEDYRTRNMYVGKIQGAIFGVTGEEFPIYNMTGICKALDIPYKEIGDGMVAWGDEVAESNLFSK
jgi:hypothetical protein